MRDPATVHAEEEAMEWKDQAFALAKKLDVLASDLTECRKSRDRYKYRLGVLADLLMRMDDK